MSLESTKKKKTSDCVKAANDFAPRSVQRDEARRGDPHYGVLCEGGFLYQKVLIFSQCSCEVDGMKTKPYYESISAILL